MPSRRPGSDTTGTTENRFVLLSGERLLAPRFSGAQQIEAYRLREIVAAFLAASREGDFGALLAVLDPDVVLSADRTTVQMGSPAKVRGARAVADTFAGRVRMAQPALVNGAP
jgi:ketosteroid isomerase-like protein